MAQQCYKLQLLRKQRPRNRFIHVHPKCIVRQINTLGRERPTILEFCFLAVIGKNYFKKCPDSEIVTAEGNDGRHSSMDEVQECDKDRIGSLC